MPTPPPITGRTVYIVDARPLVSDQMGVGDFIDQLRKARDPLSAGGPAVEGSMPLAGLACSSFDGVDLEAVRQDAQVVLGMCPPQVAALSIADAARGQPIAVGLWYAQSADSPLLEWCGGLALAEDGGLLIVAQDGSGLRIGTTHVEFLPQALSPGGQLEAGLVRAIDAWTTWRCTAGNA